jgi:hypothetical protein
VIEFITGAIVFAGTLLWGNAGLWGIALFFVAMILTRGNPDEREIVLLYKVTALHACAMGVCMGVIYVFFPNYNWFYGFISFALLTRGFLGILVFSRE